MMHRVLYSLENILGRTFLTYQKMQGISNRYPKHGGIQLISRHNDKLYLQ